MKLRNKKTGEIFDAGSSKSERAIGIYYEEKDGQIGTKESFYSLAELNEEWEDYKPTEPLIKDEKVKKLLGEVVELELTVNELSKRFDEFNKHYAELCGEEEECES